VKVERRAIIGADWRLEKVLADSEDSSKLNTSFIERLNLTIRQGSAYLSRRTICHARWKERLEDHLELIRCYYNFVRPHRALIRTRGPDTGHAGGIDRRAADVQGDLLLDDEFFGAAKHHTCVLRLDHVGQCGRFAHFYGGVATLDGGSTLDSILATDTKTDTAGNQDSGAAPQAIDNIANRHAVEPGAY